MKNAGEFANTLRINHCFTYFVSKLGRFVMLETIIVVLLVLWLLGAFVMPIPAVGGLVHLLLVVVLVVVVIRFVQGRRPL